MSLREMSYSGGFTVNLPCAEKCPFGRNCTTQYFENDNCAEVIHDTIKSQVSEKSSEIFVRSGKLRFTTTDPDAFGSVSGGELSASRL